MRTSVGKVKGVKIMEKRIVKRIALVLVTFAIVTGIGYNQHMTVQASRMQMMKISCHYCHEIMNVNILKSSAKCSHCGKVNHFDG